MNILLIFIQYQSNQIHKFIYINTPPFILKEWAIVLVSET